MVGIVVVSHSDALAQGVVRLAREMAGPELAIEAAGGIGEEGVLGTSAELVGAAIERAMSPDGVLVLMDLGSALMSAELAVELLEGASGPVRLSAAPLVEGAVAAAAAAGGGATLDRVADEAGGALAMKADQIGEPAQDEDAPGRVAPDEDASGRVARDESGADASGRATPDAAGELAVQNEVGLHARPAARLVQTVAAHDADVLIARVGSGRPPVSARSLINVVSLGARRGDAMQVLAYGPQAGEVLAALRELAAGGFGDGLPEPAAEPGSPEQCPPERGPREEGVSGQGQLEQGVLGQDGPEQGPAEPPRPVLLTDGTELHGVPAGTGIASGPARPITTATAVPARAALGADAERALLERALSSTRTAISADRERLRDAAGERDAEIFDAHLALLDDEALLEPARAAIAAGAPAEVAVSDAAEQVAETLRRLESSLLAERAADVLDVGRRIGAAIAAELGPGASSLSSGTGTASPHILIAADLTPSQTVTIDPDQVVGIATARGSATAHAAIIARALGIPAVVGLGDAILTVPPGTLLLLDGDAGTVTVAPPESRLADARARAAQAEARSTSARAHAHEPARLQSGERIEVLANIGSLADARLAVEQGAEGVGLLRTEFLFLDRAALPSEEEQAETLRQVAEALGGRPLVVRTLDAGADKPLPSLPMAAEANPFLGVRGIRVGLRRPELLATQMRAALRVAAEHPVRLMLPMVASLAELSAARELLDGARQEMGISAPLELGIMVEVPAAALMAAELAPHVDFFSIGTNDLTQYTMAAERGNAQLESLLTGPQPAVLRLIQMTVAAARPHGRPVAVCGELAADPAAAVLLVGLGVSELSMAPRAIPNLKQALRGVSLEAARSRAEAALMATDAGAARALAADLV